MPAAVAIPAAFVVALAVTAWATPRFRRLAVRTDFYDHPAGYKQHRKATPYLGGAAVMTGFLAGAILFGNALVDFETAIFCAAALFVVGTIDDRVGLPVTPRLAAQVAAAVVLWWAGASWQIGGDLLDLSLTVVWVVGMTNAFNLMDNLDGAAATVAATSALGIGVVSASEGGTAVAALSFALAGACAGFIPYNLARPARIFLGDGGSTPIGFLLAAAVMAFPHGSAGWAALLASAPLVGLPIFDTTLVVISRQRRGARILSGGRDHLTHRLLSRLGSARAVCVALAIGQTLLFVVGLAMASLSQEWVAAASACYLVAGLVALGLLETIYAGGVHRGSDQGAQLAGQAKEQPT